MHATPLTPNTQATPAAAILQTVALSNIAPQSIAMAPNAMKEFT
jgi:hypothetical protein